MDGQPATADDVQPGMVVSATVTLSADTAAVTALQATSLLVGPITAIDAAHLRLTVLGRAVQVDSATVIAQRGDAKAWTTLAFGDLKTGDVVGVHGFAQTDGSVDASRIERLPASAPTAAGVAGVVSSLDSAAKTFFLDATKVDYSAATVEGTLANGARAMASGAFVGAVLKASRVVVLPVPPPLPRVLVGPLSDLNASAKTFKVGPVLVDYSSATVVGTLANGVFVAVEGTPGATAALSLKATKVTVVATPLPNPLPWDGLAAGPVTALDGAGNLKVGTSSFWMDGRTIVMGIGPSATSAMSAMAMAVQLKVGDWVVVGFVRNTVNALGVPYAAKIAILPPKSLQFPLIGPVSAFKTGARTFTLQGFTVQPAATTRYGVGGKEVDAATFWGTDRSGVVAEAVGTAAGGVFTAQGIQVR